ncbi:MAG: hypothetical protein ACE5FT_01430 [Candidatus Nanoarchaeia archaeon]
MKKFLITRPEHDDTTHYLSNWSALSIKEAKKQNLQVYDLNRDLQQSHSIQHRQTTKNGKRSNLDHNENHKDFILAT